MPCNGISVASVRIDQDIQKYLDTLPQATIDQAVVIYLKTLGYQATGSSGYFQVNPIQTAGRQVLGTLKVSQTLSGGFTLSVRNGRIVVSGAGRTIREDIGDKLLALMTGLASKARQAALVNALKAAGVNINKTQAAPNGAVVLSVEL
jgi:hypothetical protein